MLATPLAGLERSMYGRERRVLLRHYLEHELSKAALAEKVGVSRRTIYYWLETGQLDRELDDQPVRYSGRPPEWHSSDRSFLRSGL